MSVNIILTNCDEMIDNLIGFVVYFTFVLVIVRGLEIICTFCKYSIVKLSWYKNNN